MFGIILAVCVTIGLPLVAFIYAIIKKRYLPFLLGVLAFTVSQMFIRIPLLDLLQAKSTTYLMFMVTQPILYAVFLGLSAGVFEELARFVLMRFLMRQRDWQSGFLFGAGHGGIEAVLFIGVGALTMMFSPNASIYSADFLLPGIERLFAILFHIGLSMLVLQGVVQRKFRYVVLAIIIHGFINSLIGILPVFMSQVHMVIIVEVSLAVTAITLFVYSLIIKRRGVL